MIIEMRTYKTKPGRRSEFLEIFRSKSIPAHTEIGMKILGPFLSVEDPDTFFWMRGFPDIPSRERLKPSFMKGNFGSANWRTSCCQCWKSMRSWWWKILRIWFAGDGWLTYTIGDLPL